MRGDDYDLADVCSCGEVARQVGPTTFEDRGPFQLISKRTMVCPNGHRWTRETDGG